MRLIWSGSLQLAVIVCGLFIAAFIGGAFVYFIWVNARAPEWLAIAALCGAVVYLANKIETLREQVEAQDTSLHVRIAELEAKMRGDK